MTETYHLKAELGLKGASARNKTQLMNTKKDAEESLKGCVGHLKIIRSLILIDCLKELKMFEEAQKVLDPLTSNSPLKAKIIQQYISIKLRSKMSIEEDFDEQEKSTFSRMIAECDEIADKAFPKDSIFRIEQVHRSYLNLISAGLMTETSHAQGQLDIITGLVIKFHGGDVSNRSNQNFYDASLLLINLT